MRVRARGGDGGVSGRMRAHVRVRAHTCLLPEGCLRSQSAAIIRKSRCVLSPTDGRDLMARRTEELCVCVSRARPSVRVWYVHAPVRACPVLVRVCAFVGGGCTPPMCAHVCVCVC